MVRAEPTGKRLRWGAGIILLACLSMVACGESALQQGGTPAGSGATGGGGATGTLVLFAEDQPSGNVLAFELTVSSATLTDSSGASVSVLPAAVELEWRSRGLAPTILSVTSVPATTYTDLTLTVSAPEMTVFDPLTSTFSEINPPLSTSTIVLPLNRTISSGEVVGLRLDLDLRNSVQLDATNNFIVNPLFDLVATSFIGGLLPGDIDDVVGTVSALNTSSNEFSFTVLSSGGTATVSVDAATLFEVVSGLGGLAVGDTIEVDARLQSSGNFRGQDIERETAGAAQQLRGLVLARTPATGDVTSLTLLVLDAIPAGFDAGDIVTVTVDASTGFRISVEDLPTVVFPNLDFDRQTLRVGQFVHVVQRSGAAGVTADSLTLEELAWVGQVGAGVGTNSFDFLPDGNFFSLNGLGQISVSTASVTELENMPAGLSSLQPNRSIVGVRGVLVFQGGNGVLVSKRVRLLVP